MPDIAILLLAAGASSRMAPDDKLMQQVDGQPVLALMRRRAVQTGLAVYVTLPDLAHPRAALIGTAIPVEVTDAAEGMAASIRAGIAALAPNIEAVMILPTDMPEIETQDMLFLASQYQRNNAPILRATAADGTPGHPVLFPRRYFPALQALTGDSGAKSVLKSQRVQFIALPGQRATTDLDTAAAWAAWRVSNR